MGGKEAAQQISTAESWEQTVAEGRFFGNVQTGLRHLHPGSSDPNTHNTSRGFRLKSPVCRRSLVGETCRAFNVQVGHRNRAADGRLLEVGAGVVP